MAANNSTPKKPSSGTGKDSLLRRGIGFFLDSPEQRKARKLRAELGQDAASVATPRTETRRPTSVSRRARLMGGKRTRAMGLMALFIVTALVAGVALGVAVSKPSSTAVREEVAKALRESGAGFPSGQAVSWADNVVIDWATWDEADRDEREVRMAQYLTAGMDSQAGWNGQGKQTVTFTSTNPQPVIIDEHHALVDVDYRLSDNSRRCVTVPVYAYKPEGLTGNNVQWAFGLSGNPIPRPCAPRTGAMDDDGTGVVSGDLAVSDEVSRELTTSFFPGFFGAWAASDNNSLRQYTASGVTTIGLGGAMSSTPAPTINDATILLPRTGDPVEGTVYHATVPVTWTVAGSEAQVTATYEVPMKLSGDRWYVAGEPEPATSTSDATSGKAADQVVPDDKQAPARPAAPEEQQQAPEGQTSDGGQ